MIWLTIVMQCHFEICRGSFYLSKGTFWELFWFTVFSIIENEWYFWGGFDVNFDMTYDGDQKTHEIYIESILTNFGDVHIWHQNLCQYLWTSSCQFIFVWTSSIVHVFDFLTFDIFLTIWHLFDILTQTYNLNHLSPSKGYFFSLASDINWPSVLVTILRGSRILGIEKVFIMTR